MRVEETMEWLRQLETLARQRMDAVLVLAVERKGSTPGAFGAKMLVTAEGRVYGTIGGGQMEYHCEQLARELISQKRSSLERLALNPEGPGELGMICGGDVTVWFQYLPGARLPVRRERAPPTWCWSRMPTAKAGPASAAPPPCRTKRRPDA